MAAERENMATNGEMDFMLAQICGHTVEMRVDGLRGEGVNAAQLVVVS